MHATYLITQEVKPHRGPSVRPCEGRSVQCTAAWGMVAYDDCQICITLLSLGENSGQHGTCLPQPHCNSCAILCGNLLFAGSACQCYFGFGEWMQTVANSALNHPQTRFELGSAHPCIVARSGCTEQLEEIPYTHLALQLLPLNSVSRELPFN